jgi:hypothetical protein
MGLAVDLDENLVEVPMPVRECPHPIDPLTADLARNHRAKPVSPKPHSLLENVGSAHGRLVFDIAKRQGVFHPHHDHEPDDLGASN